MPLILDPVSGYLPPGPNPASVEDVESALVSEFPTSTTRRRIFDHWVELRAAIGALATLRQQWVDGSFATSTTDPRDIDLATFFFGEELDALSARDQMLMRGLVAGPTSRVPDCDSYAIIEYPKGHPMRAAFERARAYWEQWFGMDRGGTPKGFAEVAP
jgi:hypothetical protein